MIIKAILTDDYWMRLDIFYPVSPKGENMESKLIIDSYEKSMQAFDYVLQELAKNEVFMGKYKNESEEYMEGVRAVMEAVADCSSGESIWYSHFFTNQEMSIRNKIKPRWKLIDDCSNEGVYCSRCHKKCFKKEWYANVKQASKYCPNCGAKMESE